MWGPVAASRRKASRPTSKRDSAHVCHSQPKHENLTLLYLAYAERVEEKIEGRDVGLIGRC